MKNSSQSSAFLLVLIMLLTFCPAKLFGQKTLNWDFSVPTIENVDSVNLKIIDSGLNIIFNDSVAVSGTINNIPTDVPIVASNGFDVETYGVGNNAKIKLNTVYSQNVKIEIYDLTGRLLNQYGQKVMQGENLFDVNLSNYASSQYILKIVGKDGYSNSRITNVGGNNKVSQARVQSLESMLKSGSGWQFIVSNPKLLTDTFNVMPSDVMDLDESLFSRPNVSGQVLNILNMVGESGKRKLNSLGRFIDEVGIEGMKVFFDDMENNFVVTGEGGYFNLRPDKMEGLNDTLYILNYFNSVDVYQFKMPLVVKSGEILDVNGKPSRLITFPIKVIEGQNYNKTPRSEDLLDGLKQMIEIGTLKYPSHPEYNGSLINMDLLKEPVKIFLDRENSTSEAYSDTIMAGFKIHEVIYGVKFIETFDKDSSNVECEMFNDIDYSIGNYMHMEFKESEFTNDGWNVSKIDVYLQNNRHPWTISWVSGHEITHAICHSSSDGHSWFLNDMYGTRHPSMDVKLTEKDKLISKLCLWPMPNPNFTSLVKYTKY